MTGRIRQGMGVGEGFPLPGRLVSSAEKAEKGEENIDEVEVEFEGSNDRDFLVGFGERTAD